MWEVWKPVPGFEGRYEVSDRGRVRSLDRWAVFSAYAQADGSRKAASRRRLKGRMLRPGAMKSGHVSVALGRGNSRLVHQLVLEAFVGPCPEGHEVLHGDHDPANNRLKNLRYGTRSENIKMDFAAGRRKGWHPGLTRWGARQ